jgi:hypothetical protein
VCLSVCARSKDGTERKEEGIRAVKRVRLLLRRNAASEC